jgi:hypothetical protein
MAILGTEERQRVRAAVGKVPARHAGFSDEEWLLRHAFSDERVRENSFLAGTLARLPMVFARAGAGEVQFHLPHVAAQFLGADCCLVAVVDVGDGQ